MTARPAGTVVILGDPRVSRVGSHMYAAYLAELSGQEHDVHVVGREQIPSEPADWPAFMRDLRAQVSRVELVFSGQEDLLELTSYLSAAFGLPHNPPGVPDRVRMKEVCRAELQAAGVLQPRSTLVEGRDGLAAFVAATDGPWVVKPRDARGSVDVHVLRSASGVAAAAAKMRAYPNFVVEEFVCGKEFSIEGVFVDGQPHAVAVTQKDLFPGPGFVEMVHQQPPTIGASEVALLTESATEALRAVGAAAGLFHVEAWQCTDGGVVVGEVHLRSGGDWIHTLIGHTRPDAPLFRLAVEDATGVAEPPAPPQAVGPGATARFLSAAPGKVCAVEGVEAVAGDPATLHVELFVGVGDVVSPLRSSDDRVGVVVARGESGADARAQADRLAALLQVRTRPEETLAVVT